MRSQPAVQCVDGVWHYPLHQVRGGTSLGLVLPQSQLPAQSVLRDELLRHLLGLPLLGLQPDNRQLTGLGRGTPTSNKVFLVGTETADGQPRLVSTLAQGASHTAELDWRVNCGNLTSALPLWALDVGLLSPVADGEVRISIRNTNTGVISDARLRFEADGQLRCAAIPGVPGQWPAVDLFLNHPAGAKTGRLLPTGRPQELVEGVPVSCVDVAVPMVLIRAADLGKRGDESPLALQQDEPFMQALRRVWVAAALRMGLRDGEGQLLSAARMAVSETLPKVAILAPGRRGAQLSVRYFTPQQAHASLAVSGACCIAAACLVSGTLAHEMAVMDEAADQGDLVDIALDNPAGRLHATIESQGRGEALQILRVGCQRNAQILLRGQMPLYRPSAALSQWLAAQAQP
ncbi:PrpF domain-containing protein [Paludibacterium sp. B53371]|uniref:PrpF domain-containing protein n=1 Tax=Paludibacterium sp. B53371 TaxID=2806263 RepID=UPI001C043F83|nr:PrpF domain-containing protein [Paludibacterium sp. B53371]